MVWLATAVLLAAVMLLAGCGLQTDEANKLLTQANAHQAEAEAIITRIKNLPADWEKIFNTPDVTQQQLAVAQQTVQARKADVDALNAALNSWRTDMKSISQLNVEDKIKEYVRLKITSIKQWQGYSEMYLAPLVTSYEGLINTVAARRPASEQQMAAGAIRTLVSESASRLEECLNAKKSADNYFKTNKLGN